MIAARLDIYQTTISLCNVLFNLCLNGASHCRDSGWVDDVSTGLLIKIKKN